MGLRGFVFSIVKGRLFCSRLTSRPSFCQRHFFSSILRALHTRFTHHLQQRRFELGHFVARADADAGVHGPGGPDATD